MTRLSGFKKPDIVLTLENCNFFFQNKTFIFNGLLRIISFQNQILKQHFIFNLKAFFFKLINRLSLKVFHFTRSFKMITKRKTWSMSPSNNSEQEIQSIYIVYLYIFQLKIIFLLPLE